MSNLANLEKKPSIIGQFKSSDVNPAHQMPGTRYPITGKQETYVSIQSM